MIPQTPDIMKSPLCYEGDKRNIPADTPLGTNQLSYKQGFPPITSIDVDAGGIAPERLDFNAALNLLSTFIYYMQSGNQFVWSNQLDYNAGAFVIGSDNAVYFCIQANGATSPNTVQNPTNSTGYWVKVIDAQGVFNINIIADGAVSTAKIANGAVTSAKIADGTIVNADIANITITGAKLVNKTITATQIADNTITAAQLAANSVGASELADNAVDTNAIVDGAVTNSKINLSYIDLNTDGVGENYGGHIDFHYDGAKTDYTSRIIENSKGLLSVLNSKGMYINNINVPLFNKISIDMTLSVDVGTVLQLSAEKGQVTLPSGGTWFVWLFVINAASAPSNALISHLSVSAGGTQVGPYNSSDYKLAGLAIRIQ